MTFIPIEISRKYNPETKLWDDVKYSPCPFGVRDLQTDRCYDGMGKNRCKWFVRYDWEEHAGCIACSHPLTQSVKRIIFYFKEIIEWQKTNLILENV